MNRTNTLYLIIIVLQLVACSAGNDDEADAIVDEGSPESRSIGVMLDDDLQENLGVSVMSLSRTQYREMKEGPAQVMNSQPVVQELTELESAQAASVASNSARDRAEKLFNADTAGSLETLEAARRQAAADEAALAVARSRIVADYGPDAPWNHTENISGILETLIRGDAILVRAAFPAGLSGSIPESLSLRRIGGDNTGTGWTATETWSGPVDPAVPGPVLFAWLDDGGNLFSGDRLTASFSTGEPLTGTSIPRSAVVFAGGTAWCFVQQEQDNFIRREVDIARPVPDGYFQTDMFSPGDRIVVTGAGLLLARETAGGGEEE